MLVPFLPLVEVTLLKLNKPCCCELNAACALLLTKSFRYGNLCFFLNNFGHLQLRVLSRF